jgi:hypothetical protein
VAVVARRLSESGERRKATGCGWVAHVARWIGNGGWCGAYCTATRGRGAGNGESTSSWRHRPKGLVSCGARRWVRKRRSDGRKPDARRSSELWVLVDNSLVADRGERHLLRVERDASRGATREARGRERQRTHHLDEAGLHVALEQGARAVAARPTRTDRAAAPPQGGSRTSRRRFGSIRRWVL